MTRAGTQRRPDAPGVRRASREFGAKARGYGSRSQAAADRRPRDGRDQRRSQDRDRRSPWRRQADRSRQLIRFGARHKAGLLGWVGILSALSCMWAFTGVTQLVTVGVSLGAAGGGAAIRHHQRNRTMNHGASRRASAAQVRAHHDAMVRTGRPATPEPASGDTVTVRSHTNDGSSVKSHTRRKAGSRRFDGKPETEADQRFFDLRASGYKGPIDQDGRKVDDHDAWVKKMTGGRS